MASNVRHNCQHIDRALAALVADLKRWGMPDSTLVVWGGEFGCTPMVEASVVIGRALGCDHHPSAVTMWLVSGGIQRGVTYGETDALSFHIARDTVHVPDLQAAIPYSLSLDHERLTYRYEGRCFRLTVARGHAVECILS